jgi:hypothetical protein
MKTKNDGPRKNAPKKNEAPAKKSARNNILLIAGAAVLMAGIIFVTVESNRSHRPRGPEAPPPMVATLSPELFTGKAREAYEAAKEIPEILRYMPCFCGCFNEFGHKNNLYCFKDDHGKICNMCQDIALESKRMHGEGMSIQKIGEAIRERYSPVQ